MMVANAKMTRKTPEEKRMVRKVDHVRGEELFQSAPAGLMLAVVKETSYRSPAVWTLAKLIIVLV